MQFPGVALSVHPTQDTETYRNKNTKATFIANIRGYTIDHLIILSIVVTEAMPGVIRQ
jgi:hypothetical protein